jgi:hypothetical protein
MRIISSTLFFYGNYKLIKISNLEYLSFPKCLLANSSVIKSMSDVNLFKKTYLTNKLNSSSTQSDVISNYKKYYICLILCLFNIPNLIFYSIS